jgi:hypothetical protein
MRVPGLSFLAPVREFFLLEEPRRAIDAYDPAQRARIAELCASSAARVKVARRTTSAVPSCLLLRDAVTMLARASAASRDATLGDAALAQLDGAGELPQLPPDPLDGTEGDAERVQQALRARDPLYLDRLEPGALERLRLALERAAEAMRTRVEARSLLHVRALRWGRLAAVVLILLYAGWFFVRRRLPTNIAAGKPVHVSSYKLNPPDGQELATGRAGFTFAVHTNVEESPNVVIDLQGDYAIDRVEVYNRGDGWWDDCLPLVLEVSRDGNSYTELARREEHFGFDKPWVVRASGTVARFVRARVARHSYLALGRVAVFGKKP